MVAIGKSIVVFYCIGVIPEKSFLSFTITTIKNDRVIIPEPTFVYRNVSRKAETWSAP